MNRNFIWIPTQINSLRLFFCMEVVTMANEEKINVGGRPPKWNTPEELQAEIDKYFEYCDEEHIPLTITGLALALDTTRETLMDYQNNDKFSYTVKKAKLRIENAYEQRLIANGRAGDIFALKNFGWTDKQEITADVKQETTINIELVDDDD